MKCPYRPITKTEDNSTTIEFEECYYDECTWYLPARTINNDKMIHVGCQRCYMYNTQSNNERERYRG